MRKIVFIDGEIYHVYNRGVDKRNIFLDDQDNYRFVYGIYVFNDDKPALNSRHSYKSVIEHISDPVFLPLKRNHIPLVEIMAFTLMPNHYHLMIRQLINNGIARFMHRLGTGYTMYLNKKYERTGRLFQGPFKAVHLSSQEQFIHLPHYIHTNPYRGLASVRSIEDLLHYRWSSFPDYAGKENFPHVTSRDFLLNLYNGEAGYLQFTEDQLHTEA